MRKIDKEKQIITFEEYFLKYPVLNKLSEIEKINRQFHKDIITYFKIIKLLTESEYQFFINKSLINNLFYLIEANLAYLNQILLSFGKKIFNDNEINILKKNKISRVIFSYIDLFPDLDPHLNNITMSKNINDHVSLYNINQTISLFNKYYKSDLKTFTQRPLQKFVNKIKAKYVSNKVTSEDCRDLIHISKDILSIFDQIILKFNEDVKEFKYIISKKDSFEFRLTKTEFDNYIKYIDEYYLCDQIGEDIGNITIDHHRNLPKPLLHAYLFWDLYHSFGNGGFSMFLDHLTVGKEAFEIVKALSVIGLNEAANAIDKVIKSYRLKMKEKFGKVIGFREFHDLLSGDEYDDFCTEYDDFGDEFEIIYDTIGIISENADKYLLENIDKFCV